MSGLSLAGIRAAILDLGRAVGAEEAAARLAARHDSVLAEPARRVAGAPRSRVLYWADPHTAGSRTSFSGRSSRRRAASTWPPRWASRGSCRCRASASPRRPTSSS
ncbi:MAG: hypothetical protein U0599_30335 [Vicinamibacteria bacterium]